MEPAGDQELVLKAMSRDRDAFEELVRRYARLVWAHVYGLIRDPAWTEDLVQETFMRAWESVGELREPAAFRGWLLTTARRLAWRHVEVNSRNGPAAEVEGATGAPIDAEEARERVQAAIGRLPERYRLPVTMHFLNGMEYDAISRSLEMANGSLRGLIARGVQKLRAELAPWWRRSHDEHP